MKWTDLIGSQLNDDMIRHLMLENSSIDVLLQNERKYSDKIRREIEYAYKNSFVWDYEKYDILSLNDKIYPESLKQINDFPPFLYYMGKKLENKNILCISGTRINSQIGKHCTEKIVENISHYENIAIINGISTGIDTIAIKKAIEKNLYTICVIPTNILSFYPIENEYLKDAIMQNGCIISEVHLKNTVKRENFVRQNRIIVGMSRAVCITESYKRGKSNILANYALCYDRDIYALPGNILRKSSELCNRLIMENKAKLVLSADDIATEYAWRKIK